MSKIVVHSKSPTGEEEYKIFNSYYLAVIHKNNLVKEGYEAEIEEKTTKFSSGGSAYGVKFTKAEKASLISIKKEVDKQVYPQKKRRGRRRATV